mmetsp:Transcript_20807/g.57138  ORF Transcript_20807/g.57138 Transcript_20807/m.57138 type:complete len:208 (-) Transcript_20807:312-935(-)
MHQAWQSAESGNRQIIREVQLKGWHVVIIRNGEIVKFTILIRDTVGLECLGHVQHMARLGVKPLPHVRGGVRVVLQVALPDLVDRFLGAHLKHRLLICQHIKQLDLARFPCELAHDQALVCPPRHFEGGRRFDRTVPIRAVDESAHRHKGRLLVCLRVNVLSQILGARIEPMRDVRARRFDERLRQRAWVSTHECRQIEHRGEARDP